MGRKLTPEEKAEIDKIHRESKERTAKVFGITVEELEEIEAKARAQVEADDSWEKELDARNRARAGIE